MVSFNVPPFVGDELKYVAKAIENHKISGGGEFTKKCTAWIENKFSMQKTLLTTVVQAHLI